MRYGFADGSKVLGFHCMSLKAGEGPPSTVGDVRKLRSAKYGSSPSSMPRWPACIFVPISWRMVEGMMRSFRRSRPFAGVISSQYL